MVDPGDDANRQEDRTVVCCGSRIIGSAVESCCAAGAEECDLDAGS